MSDFAVSQYPSYRRSGNLCTTQPTSASMPPPMASPDECGSAEEVTAQASALQAPGDTAEVWETKFGDDMRRLACEILIHICGESCYKYSGAKVEQICRHGPNSSAPPPPRRIHNTLKIQTETAATQANVEPTGAKTLPDGESPRRPTRPSHSPEVTSSSPCPPPRVANYLCLLP